MEVTDETVTDAIRDLISTCGVGPETFEADLVLQMIQTSLRLLIEGHDTGQLKLMNRALKEMRYAYRIFNEYKGSQRLSIFGSARTPEDHPDYIAAKNFSSLMAEYGWMCITGAANGIMKAGHEGNQKESSFGLSIKLPFEIPTNSVILGDPKLIMFRYFFTRKLMFMSHSEAIAVFPGGVGTMDELFEVLTLMQTGKANIVPAVLLEGEGGDYWQKWNCYVHDQLLVKGWISPEDKNLYYLAKSPEDAVSHILQFYHRYHSSRYVKDNLVLRLKETLRDDQLAILNQEFSDLLQGGEMKLCGPFPEETSHLDMPRLTFHHNRKHFGLVRLLIDRINSF